MPAKINVADAIECLPPHMYIKYDLEKTDGIVGKVDLGGKGEKA